DAYMISYNYEADPPFPGGRSNPTGMPNLHVKPLETWRYEVGNDISIFKNRSSLNMTYYPALTSPQHPRAVVASSSATSSVHVSPGVVQNSGLETESRIVPIRKTEGLGWIVSPTFSTNKNKVVKLTDEMNEMILQNGPGSRGVITARVGGRMDELWGRGYNRAPDGQIIYENGLPTLTDSVQYIGQTNPAWRVGLHNEFRYKQFRLG